MKAERIMVVMERLACILVGYLCGMVLTADIVARARAGKSAFNFGTRNPGMANIGANLGAGWAAVVLAGDIGKTILACELCRWALCPDLSQLAVLYAGIGCVLGHNFPAWHRFHGGKGVTVTCSAIVLFSPVLGGIALVAGFGVMAATRYLCYGAVAIPAIFLAECLLSSCIGWPAIGLEGAGLAENAEALTGAAALLALMCIAHGSAVASARRGGQPKTTLFKR